MKHIFQLLFLSVLLLAITSCKKAENKIFFEGGTPPALSASTANVVLEPGLEANTALVLNWTNPDFKFTTGLSSQDVTYTLEMDTLGANFSSSKKYTTVIAKDLSKSFTVGELNGILGNTMILQLNPRRDYNLQIRVIASIGSSVSLPSNTISFTAKPFAPPPKVPPPPSGQLFITGSATDGGWMAGGGVGVPTPDQQFTQVSPTLYTLTVHLIGGQEYLFVPVNGDWGNKYACHNTSSQPKDGGDFGYNGANSTWNANFPGPLADGTYKISVDFQIGKYTVTQ